MHVESYIVEVQNLTDGEWIEDQSFSPEYKWAVRRLRGFTALFGLLRRAQPEIQGSATVQAMIAKADAYQRARQAIKQRKPRSVRIVRVWREGAHTQRVVIWVNGEWYE